MHVLSRDLAFVAVMLGMLMAQLDTTVVVAAIPTLDSELHAGPAIVGVTTAYLVTVTVATLVHGRLGDRYGRRAMFIVSIVVFAAGSAVCAAAPDIGALIAARAIQGIGGSGLIVTAMSALGELFDKTELIRRAGWQTAVFAVSSLGGPPVGGLLAGGPGWRWIFLLNLPICLVALVLGVWGLPGKGKAGPRGFLAGMRQPFGDRVVGRSVLVTGLAGVALFGTFTYVSLVIALDDRDATSTGLLLTAMTAGQLLVSASFAVLARRWPRMVPWGRLGCAFGVAGMVLLAVAPHVRGLVELVLGLALVGASFGLCASAYTLLAQTRAAAGVMGATMGVLSFVRQAGGVLGTLVFGWLAVVFTGSFDAAGLTAVFVAAAVSMLLAWLLSPRSADEAVTNSEATSSTR